MALMLMGCGGGGSSSSPILANFQSVNSDSWRATYASPPTFLPDSSPEYFTVVRQGYNALGSAVNYNENFICTKLTRQVYPNQASLTADQVALNDYIYSTDSVSGKTNNAAETSPKPIANWSMFDRKIVGDTLYLEVVAFHRNARQGEQVACVEFTVSDGTNTVTQKVSTSSLSTMYSALGQKVVVYSASIDVSSLANPATLTCNAKIYPWIGASASILDSTAQSLPRELSPRVFRRDTAFTPRYAYVRTTGNDGTGVVSTNSATASANPFLTVLAAINAHHTAGGMDGAIIYIGNDGGTPFVLASTAATRTQSHSECIITREPGVARANARVSFGAAAFRARFGTAGGWLRFYDVGIDRTGTTQIQGEVASTLQLVFDEVSYVGNSHNATVNNANAQSWFGGCDFTSLGASTLNSFTGNTTRCIRNCTFAAPSGVEGWLLLGNRITSIGAAINYANTSPSGAIAAFNFISNQDPLNSTFSNDSTTATGMAFVQNILEWTSATGGRSMRLCGDDATNNLTHIVIHHNTFVGFHNNGRANVFYDEGVTPRTCKLQSCVGNIHVAINTKGDVFVANGTRVGNWGYLYGVGCRHEFSMFIDADSGGIGSSFAQAYPGIGANIGTSATVRNDPLFTNYQGTTSGPTAGAGNGTYTVSALSPCKSKVTIPVLKYDLAGNSRSMSASTIGAYE